MLLTAGLSLQSTCLFHVCIPYHCEKGRSLNSRPAWYTMILSGHPKLNTHTKKKKLVLNQKKKCIDLVVCDVPNYNSGTWEMRWTNHADFLKDHSVYSEFKESQRFIMGQFFKNKKKKRKKISCKRNMIFGV